ncbi:MAG: class I SAM-dependent methyltransferase [Alphaproteobacteria bacterium]|nr:class I SAM-dependent methyltransferase [Alphaproteobacteria bacterium]
MNIGPKSYWENAGAVGYGEAMFGSREVERHVNRRLWRIAVEIGFRLGLTSGSRVLDLGCGDGAFANQALAPNFAAIDGFDLSEAAIRRAQANAAGPHLRFAARDVARMPLAELGRYDGAFLIGILHHVKPATPAILRQLRGVTDRVVVLEPNGNHLMRKLLELTPDYRAAGEDSFRRARLARLFAEAGYHAVVRRRLNLFPNFTPRPLFRALQPLEAAIEATPLLRALCTVELCGFVAAQSEPG